MRRANPPLTGAYPPSWIMNRKTEGLRTAEEESRTEREREREKKRH